jgi:peptidoglycan/xylan/chitin deacetylase (PgdA/CDA1 family)
MPSLVSRHSALTPTSGSVARPGVSILAAGALSALSEVRRRRSVVVGYHGIGETRWRNDLSLLQVSPDRFRSQIELLDRAGFRFCTLVELARLADGGTPPPGLAAITFDDGLCNNREVALPILEQHGAKATVYVTVGLIGASSLWIDPAAGGSIMTEPELRELAAAGWELGAHTMTHPDLSTLDYDSCRREIEDSRTALEEIAGAPVETFAYPFGRYGPQAIAAARDSGFIAAVTTGSGSWAPFEMTRAMIGHADPLAVVLLKLTDRYEPLLSNAPMRLLRDASKRLRGGLQARRRAPLG